MRFAFIIQQNIVKKRLNNCELIQLVQGLKVLMNYLCGVSKKVVVSVTNDLLSDQRVNRTCETLVEEGFDVLLIGRRKRESLPLKKRSYSMKRLPMFFHKGIMFYAEFNIRLFIFLLFTKFDVLHANDLDTLLANRMAQVFKGGELVYDTHEYFTEVPELKDNPFAKRVWLLIERAIFKKLKHVFTVNQSIANIYGKLYNVELKVMRNVPMASATNKLLASQTKKALKLPADKKIILLQGSGINIDRGAEEMVEAMQWIDAVFLIVGTGDVISKLKENVSKLDLQEKVIFTGRVPFDELIAYTKVAHVGVTLDKDSNLNYKYSLPNKLFDYFQCDLPVIASDLVEVRRIINYYNAGLILSSHQPRIMAEEINAYLNDESFFNFTKQRVQIAKNELIWENEKHVLIDCYKNFG